MESNSKIGIILLAAGSSSRMGQSKQLLKWNNETLLSHAVNTALNTSATHIAVVLGANEADHRNAIKDFNVAIISNPEWQKGMGSSLKKGMDYFINESLDVDGVIIMVCDQPFVTSSYLNELITAFSTTDKIIASKYKDTLGVPVLFPKEYFSKIMKLSDSEGAKKILQNHSLLIKSLDFPEGSFDIDTPEDFKKLLNENRPS